ncbi:extensin-like [Portunus trituberculatus]|uniref:extensin-like n=1 Tax=Portunus trituberculatus TaxID=210409 RepID=UPI001E1D212C|nr:extensin-like [Portunus trituberculatus]
MSSHSRGSRNTEEAGRLGEAVAREPREKPVTPQPTLTPLNPPLTNTCSTLPTSHTLPSPCTLPNPPSTYPQHQEHHSTAQHSGDPPPATHTHTSSPPTLPPTTVLPQPRPSPIHQ